MSEECRRCNAKLRRYHAKLSDEEGLARVLYENIPNQDMYRPRWSGLDEDGRDYYRYKAKAVIAWLKNAE